MSILQFTSDSVRMSRYAFTIFKYEEGQFEKLQSIGDRIIFQEERCPKTGRYHIQGYVEWNEPVQWIDCKLRFGSESHVEDATADQAHNVLYCSKEKSRIGRLFNRGFEIPKKQGRRTDITRIQRRIDAGESMVEIARDNFGSFIRYHRGFERYRLLVSESRSFKTKVIIYWGPSGTGKTKKAGEENPNAYWMPQQTGDKLWFDEYAGEDTIIWDEFYGQCPWNVLLKLCDRYPLKVQVKGGYVNWAPKTIIFTSNVHWTEWYNWELHPQMKKEALERRIDQCILMTNFFASGGET